MTSTAATSQQTVARNLAAVVRENAYELFRPADEPLDDDIPADARTVSFA